LGSSRTVAEVGAEKHGDATVHALLSKVDVGLLDSAFEIFIAEFPVNSRLIVTDSGIKRASAGGGNRGNFLVPSQQLTDFLETLRPHNR
jgi:hypothetical protein